MTQDPMQGGTDRNRNTISAVHSLDRQLHEDLHTFLKLYEKSVNAKGDIRDAIEKSTTALMNRLSVIEGKIDGIGSAPGGGITPEDEAAAKRIRASAQSASERLTALAARQ